MTESQENTPTMDQKAKPFWKSKRFYITFITAVLPLIPPVASFARNYPEMYSGIMAALFGWVGLKTVGPMSLKFK